MDGPDVVVGVVSAPALGRRWWAALGGGAWTGRSLTKASPCRVSGVTKLSDASLSYSGLGGWAERGLLDNFLGLTRSVWRSRAFGDFWSHMLVAEGACDVSAEPEVNLWDLAALQVIVTEAGGRVHLARRRDHSGGRQRGVHQRPPARRGPGPADPVLRRDWRRAEAGWRHRAPRCAVASRCRTLRTWTARARRHTSGCWARPSCGTGPADAGGPYSQATRMTAAAGALVAVGVLDAETAADVVAEAELALAVRLPGLEPAGPGFRPGRANRINRITPACAGRARSRSCWLGRSPGAGARAPARRGAPIRRLAIRRLGARELGARELGARELGARRRRAWRRVRPGRTGPSGSWRPGPPSVSAPAARALSCTSCRSRRPPPGRASTPCTGCAACSASRCRMASRWGSSA